MRIKLGFTLLALLLVATGLLSAAPSADSSSASGSHLATTTSAPLLITCEILCWEQGTQLCYQDSRCHTHCCESSNPLCTTPCN
ncbi:MAG TPA: hypothetical protein VFE33_24695 [Thermoanaerobaculia bacterium]|nr:hypothetical protein [Thermoanaerobaculia bacterium]